VNLGLELEWYPKYLNAATGQNFTIESLYKIAERVSNIVRAFWIRENVEPWTKEMDYPPSRWFNESLKESDWSGGKLYRDKYALMLQAYYAQRGWDKNGVPTKETLENLDLSDVAAQLHRKQ